ncbi:type II toxin-antitoxin system RelE/ParE family toxin [Amycolatopsis sp. NPDC006125]|uniref:type II toxin-antitoxin system RelE/ParE family toxin n=1 Tax=Amycolatopsis sp. NPDC006125 TaxID=3156730 RepID=UPI0033B8D0CA
MSREWQFYTAPGGGSPVEKDIRRANLAHHELGRMQEIMDRVAEGRALPKEVKYLRDGVFEFKLNLSQRTYRLLYAEVDGNLVLLALHFFAKKKQVDKKAIDVAVERLRNWQAQA